LYNKISRFRVSDSEFWERLKNVFDVPFYVREMKQEKCDHLRLNKVLGAYRCTQCGAWFKVKKAPD